MLDSEREAKTERVITHNCTRRSTQDSLSGTPTVYQHKSFIKAPCCLPSPTTHTHISPSLQQNPLSSLHFHQNIADEVLRSINHFAALLYCPLINHQAHHTAGPGLRNLSFWEWLCCHWMYLRHKWIRLHTDLGMGLLYLNLFWE